MAKAQQKPKKVSGTRNSDGRRNGKAWSKNHGVEQPKPTGKSIMGYKRERVEKWAQEAGLSLEAYVKGLKAGRDLMKQKRRENRAAVARMLKGADKMYRDGTLVNRQTPCVPRQRKGGEVTVVSTT